MIQQRTHIHLKGIRRAPQFTFFRQGAFAVFQQIRQDILIVFTHCQDPLTDLYHIRIVSLVISGHQAVTQTHQDLNIYAFRTASLDPR